MLTEVVVPADVKEICAIEKEALPYTAWSEKMYNDELKGSGKHYYKVLKDGEIAAYGGFMLIDDYAEITNIAVRKDLRNKGYGKFLLNHLICAAIESGAKRMTLEVAEDNLPALRLYENSGFTSSGIRPRYYNNSIGAVIMWKVL